MPSIHRATIAFLLLATLGGCTREAPVEIGAVLPLTGEWQLYGTQIRNGIELAYDQLQKAHQDGKLPFALKLDVQDSGSDPQKAAQEARDLYHSGVAAVVGGVTSDEALAMVPVADQADAVLLSPSASSPELSGISKNFYRIYPSDFREGTRMGNFAAQTLELKKLVILRSDTTFAKGISEVFKNEFERYDGKVVAQIDYPPSTEDFSEVVDEALSNQPDGIFLADFADRVTKILQTLREKGYTGRVLTTSAFATPEAIAGAGEAATGVFLSQIVFDADSDDPVVQRFVQAYKDKYGDTPGLYAAHGYDALMVLAEAIKGGGRTRQDIWKGLRGLRSYVGVTGTIQFNEKGDVGKFPRVYVIQDGKLIDYDHFVEERRKKLMERLHQIEEQGKAANQGGTG